LECGAATANGAIDRGLISASRRALRQDGLDRTVTLGAHGGGLRCSLLRRSLLSGSSLAGCSGTIRVSPAWSRGAFPEWRHILASLIVIAPFALVPGAFTFPSVLRQATFRRILVLASLGSLVALPLVILAVVPSACYVAHDCL
jgi:hypothetical protein